MLIYYNEKYNFMWGKRVDTTVMKSLKSIALVGVGQMTSLFYISLDDLLEILQLIQHVKVQYSLIWVSCLCEKEFRPLTFSLQIRNIQNTVSVVVLGTFRKYLWCMQDLESDNKFYLRCALDVHFYIINFYNEVFGLF